jgi:hypothetical protein
LQILVGPVGFGHHDRPRGVFIQPVNDAGTLHPANARQGIATVGQQRIHQRAAHIAGSRMHHHPRCLIDDDQMLVLVQDIEGNGLSDYFEGLRLRHSDLNSIPRLHQPLFIGAALPVQGDGFPLNQLLDTIAGEVWQLGGEPTIQAGGLPHHLKGDGLI